MISNIQKLFGFFNSQNITNNTTVVNEQYLRSFITYQNNPSDLNTLVLALYDLSSNEDFTYELKSVPPEIEVKINFNNVVAYKELIDSSYSENGFLLDSSYQALDSEVPGRKKRLLAFINSIYISVLADLVKANPGIPKIEIVKKNADLIINQIITNLLTRISRNPSQIEHLATESIEYNVIAIVCNAFVDCKVLENPNDL